MTCEVAVMNKYAVVLAADSAVTTSDGNGAERYSKGGNKIFQLSKHQPVGVMIFGSAMLDGVPWEIIIKAYRQSLGNASFATLAEYSTSFFSFVKNAAHFYPQDDLDKNYGQFLTAAALRLLKDGRTINPIIDDGSKPIADRKAAWDGFLGQIENTLAGRLLHPLISADAYQQALANVAAHNTPEVTAYLDGEGLTGIVDAHAWFTRACQYFFTCHTAVLNGTGIIFSGYGSEQYFPEVIEYDVSGFVGNDFVFSKKDEHSCAIGHGTLSAIFQFAMTSSIDTFTTGVDVNVFGEVRRSYAEELKKFATGILGNAGAQVPIDLDMQIGASLDAFCKDWVPKVYDMNYSPMKAVIASLPIEEMAHLAETLVVLQSLKERVTSPRQSVGGPIDVAVITKSEGLVWIKRKHFFEAEKNLRYVQRVQAHAM